MKNRTILFGYKMQNGKLVINIEEKAVLVEIFNSYINGNSYLKIAEKLTKQGKLYMPEKPKWNKNMVARILQNEEYLNVEKYPLIINRDLFEKAKNSMTAYRQTETREIKKLKEKLYCVCGAKIRRRVKPVGGERWYCSDETAHISIKLKDDILMQNFINIIENIDDLYDEKTQKSKHQPTKEMIILLNEIERMMNSGENNQKFIEEKLLELGSLKYEQARESGCNKIILRAKLDKYYEDKDIIPILEIVDKIEIDTNKIERIIFNE
ncbi:MAG: recombinase family protein [Clostridia bacterium]